MKIAGAVTATLLGIGLAMVLAVPTSSAAVPESKLPVSKLEQYLPTTAEASAAVGFAGELTTQPQYPDCTSYKGGSYCSVLWTSTATETHPYYAEVGTYSSTRNAKATVKTITNDAVKSDWIVWKRVGSRVVYAPNPEKGYSTEVWFVQRKKKSVSGAGCRNNAAGVSLDTVYQCAEQLYQSMKLP